MIPWTISPPVSSVHGISQRRILSVGSHFLLQGIFLSQGSNLCFLCLLHCRQDLYLLSHQGNPSNFTSCFLIACEVQSLSYVFQVLIQGPMQFCSVAQSCSTLCDPTNRSTSGLSVYHQLLEFTQTRVHRVSDAIQPFHPLSSPSPPAPNPSQHQSLFQ